MEPIIRVTGVSKRYQIGAQRSPYGSFRESLVEMMRAPLRRIAGGSPPSERILDALSDVSFQIEPGEVVGIIGRNGAGKSTLLKILSRIAEPSAGRIELYGRVASLLEVGTGFHPELTGRENVFLNGAILGMRRAEIRRKFDEIVAFTEIEKFLDTPVKFYSSGMYVRLAFAVAAHLEPEILVVDEVLAVGDAAFQKKCIGKMSDVAQHGRTVLFVSHNMAAVKTLCSRTLLLDQGRLVADGPSAQVISSYLSAGRVSSAEIVWNDMARAPGTDIFRLRSVRLRNAAGDIESDFSARESIDVEIEYVNLVPGSSLGASIYLSNEEGVLIFASLSNREAQWHGRPFPGGAFRSTCRIPGFLLADGRYEVSVVVWGNNYTVFHREDSVAEFQVHEGAEVRNDFFGEWHGVVRPLLDWQTEQMIEGSVKSSVG